MSRALRRLWKLALLAGGLIAAGVLLREGGEAGWFDPGFVTGLGTRGMDGWLIFLALGTAACAVGVPRQAVAFAGGTAFGAALGTALGLAAMLLGCAASFAWARLIARDSARARVRGRLARLEAFLAANTFHATLTLRLLPVGNNLALNLLAGAAGVPALPFLAGSALGYLPQTLVFALLGKGVRVDGAWQLALGAALLVASVALGFALWRRARPRLTPGD
jgi:uncharacterized membrane protein YdjX (TVP38/TMEM64 family)